MLDHPQILNSINIKLNIGQYSGYYQSIKVTWHLFTKTYHLKALRIFNEIFFQ